MKVNVSGALNLSLVIVIFVFEDLFDTAGAGRQPASRDHGAGKASPRDPCISA